MHCLPLRKIRISTPIIDNHNIKQHLICSFLCLMPERLRTFHLPFLSWLFPISHSALLWALFTAPQTLIDSLALRSKPSNNWSYTECHATAVGRCHRGVHVAILFEVNLASIHVSLPPIQAWIYIHIVCELLVHVEGILETPVSHVSSQQ